MWGPFIFVFFLREKVELILQVSSGYYLQVVKSSSKYKKQKKQWSLLEDGSTAFPIDGMIIIIPPLFYV